MACYAPIISASLLQTISLPSTGILQLQCLSSLTVKGSTVATTSYVPQAQYSKSSGYDGPDLRCFKVANALHKNVNDNTVL